MLRSRFRTDESGATLVTVAVTMVLLMGLAAIAIDLGLAFAEKRTDQIGADTAVMAGAIELVEGGQIDDVVTVVMAFVDTNIRATAVAEWEACADGSAYPVTAKDLGATVQTDCISFDTFERMRVRVPDQGVDTTFGAILGFDLIDVAAAAEALAVQFDLIGTPPPFAVLSGASGGDVVCLRTSAAGNPPLMMNGNGPGVPATRGTDPVLDADPCDDTVYPADSETFGLLDPWAYFDDDGTIACKQNVNDYFIAAGIDHPLTTFLGYGGYSVGDPEIEDGDGCGGNPKSPVNGPNTIAIKTGLTASELRCGMLTSGSGQCGSIVPGPPATNLDSPARLHQGAYVQNSHRFVGEDMDNAALWDFFTEIAPGVVGFTNAPASCDLFAADINLGLVGYDYYDKRDKLLECMNDWNPSSHDPIFRADLWDSSRFAFIPLLAESTLDTAAGSPIGPGPCPASGGFCVHIDDFVPAWFQTLYTQSPSAACDDLDSGWGMHHAGQQNSCGKNNGNLDRLSGIIIDCGMLPQNLCEARPGPPNSTPGGDVPPTLELTK